jgi:hypothetical protein
MELHELIIKSGKVKNISARIHIWVIPILILLSCLWAVYDINFTPKPIPIEETEYFLSRSNFIFTILFSLFIIFCIYLLARGEKILKTVVLKDSRSNSDKEKIIEKLRYLNNWKLSKKDKNIYEFWENNFYFQSYDITIVFDEKGFYVNTLPTVTQVLDFGYCRKKSEEICSAIKEYL